MKAIITRITTRPHPNADRLQLGTAVGHQVILGPTIKTGDLGIFFPPDLQLSSEFCHHNNLYRKGKGNNSDPDANGYLEENRRVRTVTLRKAKGEGLWLPLSSLDWTGSTSNLKPGQTLNAIGKHEICKKYHTPAAKQKLAANQQQKRKAKAIPMFHQHRDTTKLRYALNTIPAGARMIITEKLHGTSGRTGHVIDPAEPGILDRIFGFFGFRRPDKWRHFTGSRRVVFQENRGMRGDIGAQLTLHKGETLYYEIVGYDGYTPIMPAHKLTGALAKVYGERMEYSYGCDPGENKIYVYRITMTNRDNITTELSWDQVEARCSELGLETVPLLTRITHTSGTPYLCADYSAGPSTLDKRHIIEGVCVRVEHSEMYGKIYKYKGYDFCDLEGIAKNSDSYLDPEDLA